LFKENPNQLTQQKYLEIPHVLAVAARNTKNAVARVQHRCSDKRKNQKLG
jgi:hypothetical protein